MLGSASAAVVRRGTNANAAAFRPVNVSAFVPSYSMTMRSPLFFPGGEWIPGQSARGILSSNGSRLPIPSHACFPTGIISCPVLLPATLVYVSSSPSISPSPLQIPRSSLSTSAPAFHPSSPQLSTQSSDASQGVLGSIYSSDEQGSESILSPIARVGTKQSTLRDEWMREDLSVAERYSLFEKRLAENPFAPHRLHDLYRLIRECQTSDDLEYAVRAGLLLRKAKFIPDSETMSHFIHKACSLDATDAAINAMQNYETIGLGSPSQKNLSYLLYRVAAIDKDSDKTRQVFSLFSRFGIAPGRRATDVLLRHFVYKKDLSSSVEFIEQLLSPPKKLKSGKSSGPRRPILHKTLVLVASSLQELDDIDGLRRLIEMCDRSGYVRTGIMHQFAAWLAASDNRIEDAVVEIEKYVDEKKQMDALDASDSSSESEDERNRDRDRRPDGIHEPSIRVVCTALASSPQHEALRARLRTALSSISSCPPSLLESF